MAPHAPATPRTHTNHQGDSILIPEMRKKGWIEEEGYRGGSPLWPSPCPTHSPPYIRSSPPCAIDRFCKGKVQHLEGFASDGSIIGTFRNWKVPHLECFAFVGSEIGGEFLGSAEVSTEKITLGDPPAWIPPWGDPSRSPSPAPFPRPPDPVAKALLNP